LATRKEDAYIIYGVQEKNNVKTPIGVDPDCFEDNILFSAASSRFNVTIPFEVLRVRSDVFYRGEWRCYIVIKIPPIHKDGWCFFAFFFSRFVFLFFLSPPSLLSNYRLSCGLGGTQVYNEQGGQSKEPQDVLFDRTVLL